MISAMGGPAVGCGRLQLAVRRHSGATMSCFVLAKLGPNPKATGNCAKEVLYR
jgi:hypothetical protein